MKKSLYILLNVFVLVLVAGCTSKEDVQVQKYQANPFLAQKDARPCVQKLLHNESITWDATCQAIIKFQQPRCQQKHDAGAWAYQNYDCHNEKQLIWMTMEGN
jgi:hypothetical protein